MTTKHHTNSLYTITLAPMRGLTSIDEEVLSIYFGDTYVIFRSPDRDGYVIGRKSDKATKFFPTQILVTLNQSDLAEYFTVYYPRIWNELNA